MEVLVRCGAQVNSEDKQGQTPATTAMVGNHNAIVEYLISAGAVETLSIAAYLGDAPKVKSLIEKGADVNVGAGTTWTPLHYAARYDQQEVADLLIAAGARLDSRDKHGRTPLHVAAAEGHLDTVRLLLANGANSNMADVDDETPLHLALRKPHVQVAELLISSGANANASSVYVGGIPFCSAAEQGLVSTVKQMIAKGIEVKTHGAEALCAAVTNNRREMVVLLLANGINVNSATESGWTALHAAVAKGHREIVKLLLARGADANRRGAEYRYGEGADTPLHWAVARGDKGIVESLLANGADVNNVDNLGLTPLHDLLGSHRFDSSVWGLINDLGIESRGRNEDPCKPGPSVAWRQENDRRTEILNIFLAEGANIDAVDGSGWTPLHVAAHEGWKDAAKVLLDKGADVNAKTTDAWSRLWRDPIPAGQTALSLALRSGYVNVAQLLIKRGADVNMPDKIGDTPLSCAVAAAYDEGKRSSLVAHLSNNGLYVEEVALSAALRKTYLEMVKRFVLGGVDVNPRDEEGTMPLHHAAGAGDVKLAEILILHGAQINAVDKRGMTPLHYAIRASKEMVELLLAHGAAVNMADQGGDTPLHDAVLRGRAEIVESLLAHNPDLSIRNSRGRTPLDEAVRRGHKEIVELLTAQTKGASAGVPDGGAKRWRSWRGLRTEGVRYLPDTPHGESRSGKECWKNGGR